MKKLSGNKQTDFLILMKLTDNELGKVCQVNKYINSLCNDDAFWMRRVHFINKYDYNDALKMKQYLEFDTWKEYYLWLDKFKKSYNYEKNEEIEKNPEEYLNLLLLSLKRKHIIDDIMNNYKEIKYPIWINKDGFLKIIKRNFFININPEINITEYESGINKNDYGALANMIIKSVEMLKDELSDEFLLFDPIIKYTESHEIV